MEKIDTPIEGLFILRPRIFNDNRGSFYESYNKKTLESVLNCEFVQDNQSESSYGTLRGLHMQVGDAAQAKLVRVLQGRVYDVAVDLRPNSPTYGQHYGIELSEENQIQFFIPRGFAHGFVVLSERASFFYKVDNYYCKDKEQGIIWNDPDLAIDWKIKPQDIVLSDKDKVLAPFKDIKDAKQLLF
jgi:dTDP-4-dehydrorhamnose 3,5-epimerase